MIISKTPLRMSFVGGGSDIPSFFNREDGGGAVISTAIDKYIYIAVNKKFDGDIRVSYSQTESVTSADKIQHPLVKESLNLTGISNGIEIASMADIPSKGSGLGSSSSFTVGLLNALHSYAGKTSTKYQLAEEACDIEINRCGEPIGKQDQFAASFGGLNFIKFNQDNTTTVSPIICPINTLKEFERSILVFYTGVTRSASSILSHQMDGLNNSKSKVRDLTRKIVSLTTEMKFALESSRLDLIGPILNEGWALKTQFADDISTSDINAWYQKGINAGATGGKLLGAGSGGFLMFYAPPEKHKAVCMSLKNLRYIPILFDNNGSQIVFYSPTISH